MRVISLIPLVALATAVPAASYPAGTKPASIKPFFGDTKEAEAVLAMTAAPNAISARASVMTLGQSGYETVRQGSNGFVCLVARSWVTDVNDSEFWNIRIRQPSCYNPAAVRSVLPAYLERTRWVLGGASIRDIDTRTRAQVVSGRLRPPEQGAMVFMTSKQGYLGDVLSRHPHPHLMFFMPKRGPEALGANQPGVQIFWADGNEQPFSIFFVLVPKWSDGTPAPG